MRERACGAILLPVTPEERSALEKLSRQMGLSIEDYVKMLFRRALRKDRGHRRIPKERQA